jgi:hypothetical protein
MGKNTRMIETGRVDGIGSYVKLIKNFGNQVALHNNVDPAVLTDRAASTFVFNALVSKDHCVLTTVDIKGLLIGQVTVHPLWRFKTAIELFWWIEPEARSLKLSNEFIRTFEDWGRKKKAQFVVFSSAPSMKSSAILYQRQKYRHFESTFIKEL